MQKPCRLKLTKKMLVALEHEIERTGVGPFAIFKNRTHIPEEITARLVSRWLNRTIETARADYYDFVLEFWTNLPSKEEKYAPITKDVIQTLRRHRKRTGISTKTLLKNRKDIPDGLNPVRVENLLQGHFKRFPRNHLEYLIWNWAQLPDKIPRVRITAEILSKLHTERQRTGVAAMALLWGTQDERPEGLNGTLINSWTEGRTKSAREDHLEYVFEKWRNLPNSKK